MSIEQAKRLFELEDNFTKQKLTKKYRELCKKYHPDVNYGSNSEEIMQKINESYDLLKNHLNDIDNFSDYKQKQIVKLKEFLSSLTQVDFSKYDSKIKNVYECARNEENTIYSKLLQEISNSNKKEELDNIIKHYRIEIKKLINSFVNIIYLIYKNYSIALKFDSELEKLILLFKDNFKNYHTINEASENFKLFTTSIEKINSKIRNNPKDKITMILEKMLIPYINNKYYNELKDKIDDIITTNIMRYSCSSYDERFIDQEVERITTLINIDINKLFQEYSKFTQDKNVMIEKLYSTVLSLRREYNSEVLVYIKKYLIQLNTITDRYEFYHCYSEFSNNMTYVIDEFETIQENKYRVQKYRDILEKLLLNFNIMYNDKIVSLSTNLNILSKSIMCLMLAERNSIDSEIVLFLNKITFKNIEEDKQILDFVDEQLFNVMRKQSDDKLNNDSNIKIKKKRK